MNYLIWEGGDELKQMQRETCIQAKHGLDSLEKCSTQSLEHSLRADMTVQETEAQRRGETCHGPTASTWRGPRAKPLCFSAITSPTLEVLPRQLNGAAPQHSRNGVVIWAGTPASSVPFYVPPWVGVILSSSGTLKGCPRLYLGFPIHSDSVLHSDREPLSPIQQWGRPQWASMEKAGFPL